ncbi:PREDICTED: uncharacterized protein LOC109167367 isoform X1 [Ipomoea nil]|uniref:uncharacterized protein LOC109167367 isoform X1 n=1 Tax=Ipomoea nil TaxID=35883 RepID=UPI0009017BBB|nr:PREDICTED: uncharacterized protein LOC109167367 isoform X1 [Ipomoea nil]
MVVGWETGGLCTVVGCCPVSWRLSTLFQKRRSPFWCSPTTKMVLAGDHGRGKRWGSSCAHVGRDQRRTFHLSFFMNKHGLILHPCYFKSPLANRISLIVPRLQDHARANTSPPIIECSKLSSCQTLIIFGELDNSNFLTIVINFHRQTTIVKIGAMTNLK